MSNKIVEYIKVICLIIIAISLAIVAWNSMNQTELLNDLLSDILYR